MLIVPTELFSKRTGHAVRTIDSFGVGIMIAKDWKDGPLDVAFKHVVDAGFGVLNVGTRELVLRIMGYKISSINCPCW